MNKLHYFFRSLFIIIFFHSNCYSQEKTNDPNYSNRIGFGAFKFYNDYLYTVSFSRILKKKNELTFPIYFITGGARNDISFSVAYNWATIKRNSRFNFYFGPELNIDYSWYPKYNSNVTVSRYGYFLCLDLIPTLKINKRILISFEFKLGHGYLWAQNDDYTFHNEVYYYERGWYFRVLPSYKLSYLF